LLKICYSSDVKNTNLLKRAIVLWGSLTLVAFVANTGLIDGISYFKVSPGIVLMSTLAPYLIFLVGTQGGNK
jgi:hypothetical protein